MTGFVRFTRCHHPATLSSGVPMERNSTSEAIVLTNRRWGELHRLVTLLSPTLGIFDAVAYGARKGKLAGGIEPFTIGTFYLYHNGAKNTYSITDIDPQYRVDAIRTDLRRLYTANTLAELAMRMHGGDFSELYSVLCNHVLLLSDDSVDPRRVLIQYIWKFVRIMGLEPDLTACPVCSRTFGEQEILSFNTGLHVPCCDKCADVDTGGFELALGPGARRYLILTRTLSDHDSVLVELSETATLRLVGYMIRYVTNILGGPLRSLAGGVLQGTMQ
ncbi:MAG: DNA repair protein RecO [Spirochaetae bacterium HGW-Spirochaetae-2]|nr:MAG: DNA repair protein RecO [Spirochaetae bacterium HGW-Spirochaetae-2]